jgi:hypothetical protein
VQNAAAMMTRSFASLILATCVAGCVADGAAVDENLAGAAGKADGQTPTIVFGEDWSETAHGRLLAGDRIAIDYDLDRLTQCRGSTNGSEVWGVTGYAMFDGGAAQPFGVSRLEGGVVKPVVASLEVPATATRVAFYFAINNRWGCIAYDSNHGANYELAIERGADGAVLSFEADWSESQSAALHAGDEVVVHYDPARLARCASSRNGYATWAVTAFWRVDGGSIKTLAVTRGTTDATLEPSDATLTVPRGRDLEVWFQATNVQGCSAYDSNLGGNYHFAIE